MPPSTIIMTQLVHLDGPRRGQIDEFRKDQIRIGRDPQSDVLMPADLRIISRNHAELVRDGNRFQLVAKGRNKCMLNGQYIDQAWLKSGDVITLAEGGPKLSFLSRMETAPATATPVAPAPPVHTPNPPRNPNPGISSSIHPGQRNNNPLQYETTFTLQYGIQIRTLKQANIKIGRNESCDFVIPHPKVCDQHCQLLFTRDNYYVRDLSGTHATLVNQRAVQGDVALQNEDIIQLGESGPELKYMGDGRFIERIQDNPQEQNAGDWETELLEDIETHKAFGTSSDQGQNKGKNIFSRLFKR